MVQSVRMSTGCSIIPFVQDEKHFESFTQIRCIIKSVYFPFWAIDVAPNYKEVLILKMAHFDLKSLFSTDGNKKRHPKEPLYNFHLILPRKSSCSHLKNTTPIMRPLIDDSLKVTRSLRFEVLDVGHVQGQKCP